MRECAINRETKETQIQLRLNVDGSGRADIETGIGFFDHMLTAFSVHSNFDLFVRCVGDVDVDCHHTVEDVGIVLGQAFAGAMVDKAGIARYGNFTIPMDEALASCSVDIGNRPYLVFQGEFSGACMGGMDTQMVEEFFRAFAMNALVTLHVNLHYGKNDHHRAEAMFKAFAHGLKQAAKKEGDRLLSSKGVL